MGSAIGPEAYTAAINLQTDSALLEPKRHLHSEELEEQQIKVEIIVDAWIALLAAACDCDPNALAGSVAPNPQSHPEMGTATSADDVTAGDLSVRAHPSNPPLEFIQHAACCQFAPGMESDHDSHSQPPSLLQISR